MHVQGESSSFSQSVSMRIPFSIPWLNYLYNCCLFGQKKLSINAYCEGSANLFDDPIPRIDFPLMHHFVIASSMLSTVSYLIIAYHDKNSDIKPLTVGHYFALDEFQAS